MEDIEVKWEMIGREYTREEKRPLLAKCIQVGMEAAFSNHIY